MDGSPTWEYPARVVVVRFGTPDDPSRVRHDDGCRVVTPGSIAGGGLDPAGFIAADLAAVGWRVAGFAAGRLKLHGLAPAGFPSGRFTPEGCVPFLGAVSTFRGGFCSSVAVPDRVSL